MKETTTKINDDKLVAKFNFRGVVKRSPGRPRGKSKPISEMTLEERLERGCG